MTRVAVRLPVAKYAGTVSAMTLEEASCRTSGVKHRPNSLLAGFLWTLDASLRSKRKCVTPS